MTAAGLRRAAAIVGALVATLLVSELLGVLKIHKHQGALPIPLSVVFLSVVYGCLTALMAVGLVLVSRANRVINFAQNGFAGVSAILFYELIHYKQWPYGAAVALALVAGIASGFLCELLFLRRFSKAPRLVATVVTLAIGQLLAAVAGYIPSWLGDRFPTAVLPKTPLGSKTWRWFPVVVTGNHILLLVVTVVILVGFAIFFRYSSAGIAIRGASENAD